MDTCGEIINELLCSWKPTEEELIELGLVRSECTINTKIGPDNRVKIKHFSISYELSGQDGLPNLDVCVYRTNNVPDTEFYLRILSDKIIPDPETIFRTERYKQDEIVSTVKQYLEKCGYL